MSNEICDERSVIRNVIISSQHLDKRSTDSIEDIVSDICGLQYDPNPTIHLNHYMMLGTEKRTLLSKTWILQRIKSLKLRKHLHSSAICFLFQLMNLQFIVPH